MIISFELNRSLMVCAMNIRSYIFSNAHSMSYSLRIQQYAVQIIHIPLSSTMAKIHLTNGRKRERLRHEWDEHMWQTLHSHDFQCIVITVTLSAFSGWWRRFRLSTEHLAAANAAHIQPEHMRHEHKMKKIFIRLFIPEIILPPGIFPHRLAQLND